MGWFRRIMLGRYGSDAMGLALVGIYFVLWVLSRLFHSTLLALAAIACVIWAFWRMLSRDLDRRRAENEHFLEAVQPVAQRYNSLRFRCRDREHRYFRCPNCGQQLRVPRGKGRISITCRSCGISFEAKS